MRLGKSTLKPLRAYIIRTVCRPKRRRLTKNSSKLKVHRFALRHDRKAYSKSKYMVSFDMGI